MGIKFLNFHTVPRCFQLMGNHIACIHQLPPDVSPDRTIKLIRPDGLVKIYHRPIPASELMFQFPKHLICHSDSFFIGRKIPHLSQSDYLKLGHKYFLLPTHFFQSVLSFVTLTSIASSTIPPKKADFVKSISSCRLFDVHKTPSGTLQIRVSDEFIARLVEEGKMRGDDEDEEQGEGDSTATATVKMSKGRVCTTEELEKDYTRLVGCRRSRDWKPKLETIREKEKRKLAKKLSSFGMKKRKKSTSHAPKGNQKSKKVEKITAPPPPPPPPPLPPLKLPKLRIPKKLQRKQQQKQQQQQQTSKKSKGKEKKGL